MTKKHFKDLDLHGKMDAVFEELEEIHGDIEDIKDQLDEAGEDIFEALGGLSVEDDDARRLIPAFRYLKLQADPVTCPDAKLRESFLFAARVLEGLIKKD